MSEHHDISVLFSTIIIIADYLKKNNGVLFYKFKVVIRIVIV